MKTTLNYKLSMLNRREWTENLPKFNNFLGTFLSLKLCEIEDFDIL